MPVRKFRSVEEMNQPLWRKPGDPALYAAIAGLWQAGSRITPLRFPPGVYRHRSIDDMNALVEQWQREHINRLRQPTPPGLQT